MEKLTIVAVMKLIALLFWEESDWAGGTWVLDEERPWFSSAGPFDTVCKQKLISMLLLIIIYPLQYTGKK